MKIYLKIVLSTYLNNCDIDGCILVTTCPCSNEKQPFRFDGGVNCSAFNLKRLPSLFAIYVFLEWNLLDAGCSQSRSCELSCCSSLLCPAQATSIVIDNFPREQRSCKSALHITPMIKISSDSIKRASTVQTFFIIPCVLYRRGSKDYRKDLANCMTMLVPIFCCSC